MVSNKQNKLKIPIQKYTRKYQFILVLNKVKILSNLCTTSERYDIHSSKESRGQRRLVGGDMSKDAQVYPVQRSFQHS